MEGTSPGKKGRFRVHREFECSRIEQAMLASAYRSILPEDQLRFAERSSDPGAENPEAVGPAIEENTDSKQHDVLAIGGH